jgi:Sugar (and other) transporter
MSSLGPYIFQNSVGFNREQALLVSGGQQIFYFLSSIIPWFIIDRAGRRKLFMIGSFGMGMCMLISGILIGIGGKSLGYAAVAFLYIFQTFFTLGWQSNMCMLSSFELHRDVCLTSLWGGGEPIGIYPSEMLPLRLRLRGGAIAVIAQW